VTSFGDSLKRVEWLLDHEVRDLLVKMAVSRRRTFPSEEAAFDCFASKVPFNSFETKALKDYIHFGFRLTGNFHFHVFEIMVSTSQATIERLN